MGIIDLCTVFVDHKYSEFFSTSGKDDGSTMESTLITRLEYDTQCFESHLESAPYFRIRDMELSHGDIVGSFFRLDNPYYIGGIFFRGHIPCGVVVVDIHIIEREECW